MSAELPGTGPAAERSGIAGVTLLIALALGGATLAGVLTVDHASEEVYGIPSWGVAVAVVPLSSVVVACGLIAWSRQPAFSAVVLAAAALGVFGLLAILSFGVVALVIASGLFAWAGSGRWSGPRRRHAAAGAILAGAPLPVLLVVAMTGPLVECEANGVTSGENVFLGLGSDGERGGSSSSAASNRIGSFSGHAQGAGYDYSYVCRDGRIVQFELRWR